MQQSEIEYVRFNRIWNQPWELTDQELDLLKISKKFREAYSSLHTTEKQKIEADLKLIEYYKQQNLFRSEQSVISLIKRSGEEIDDHWLTSKRAKAVKFKQVAFIIMKYREHQAWGASLSQEKTLLNLLLPYLIKEGYPLTKYNGPGILQVKVTLQEPMIRHLREVKWRQIEIKLTERCVKTENLEWWEDDSGDFGKRPFAFLDEDNVQRLFTFSASAGGYKNLGFLDWVNDSIFRIIKDMNLTTIESPLSIESAWSVGPSQTFIKISQPSAASVQHLLDVIAANYFNYRCPKRLAQLQCDVAPDLSAISAAHVFKEPNPYGCFYNKAEQPIDPNFPCARQPRE